MDTNKEKYCFNCMYYHYDSFHDEIYCDNIKAFKNGFRVQNCRCQETDCNYFETYEEHEKRKKENFEFNKVIKINNNIKDINNFENKIPHNTFDLIIYNDMCGTPVNKKINYLKNIAKKDKPIVIFSSVERYLRYIIDNFDIFSYEFFIYDKDSHNAIEVKDGKRIIVFENNKSLKYKGINVIHISHNDDFLLSKIIEKYNCKNIFIANFLENYFSESILEYCKKTNKNYLIHQIVRS